ncbi:ShlB/FhaC/HecB family hemolysin secretion/activation protein [Pseudoxanthomonas sp.]|uniref:ShlB/FhaC/HecB family hemolysin secretion/activation protein n=1 Tax=Pseudoxanthomonas sp. TaxID=1871049 RepID=UPI00258AC207|nr:ShlB/FhaC/HecB family hemolysin secretion/activation protein [Pseudoxanthomonas sp.]MCR6685235.1 BamA/TamA family outer membrane protein [Pseudoxanthomonas sp.]
MRPAPSWMPGLCAVLLACAGTAAAAPPPDAGTLQNQAERTLAEPAPPPPPGEEAQAAMPDPGPEFVVRRFDIQGARLVAVEELQRELAPWRDRPLCFADLQAAQRAVVALYRAHGWFARVQLPEQDITDGTVAMVVVEARFGRLGVQDEGRRARGDFIARLAGRGLEPGAPYPLQRLERGLLLANDLPGVSVDGVLQAGQTPGTSDLVLQVDDLPLLGGSVAIGNDGSRYTGRTQAIARLTVDNPSGYGDQLSASGMRGRDLEYAGASYALPLGASGLRGSLAYTSLRYRLGKEFESLDATGASRLQRAGLSYPLRRSERWNLEMELAWARRRQEDDSLGQALRRRDVDDLALSLYGDAVDRWRGGGHTAWILDLGRGRTRLGLPEDRLYDAAGAGVQGRFALARLELRHDRWLDADRYLRARLNGQWADGNLDSSQQFVLGGPTGVRGYPVNEAAGDSGAVLQLELHRVWTWPRQGELDGHLSLDTGTIRQRQDPWDGWDMDGARHNRYRLSAFGAGLRWTRGGLSASIALAAPLGGNPGVLEDGNQDGTRRTPQLWFNLRQRFPP